MEKRIRLGLFDSGIGGFSVLRECLTAEIGADFFYYGDNARAPYGERSEEEIGAFVREALDEFALIGVDAVILACNTATAVCADEVRGEYGFPIVGTEPAVKSASAYPSAAVLCTPRTAESARLRALIARFPQTRFEVIPSKGLAIAVEDFYLRRKPLDLRDHLPKTDCACAVLGCTHYSLIRRKISTYWEIPVLDGERGTARRAFGVIKVGRDNHLAPPKNTNDCLGDFSSIWGKHRIFFLGSGKIGNKALFDSNICFKNF